MYRNHYKEISRYVSGRVRDREQTEDIVQETFTLAWKKYSILRGHPNPVGWLKCTARYKIYEWSRSEDGWLSLEEIGQRGKEPGEEDAAFSREEWRLLFERSFTGKEKEIFGRYFLRGTSARTLAAEECVTEGNMRVRLYRLKMKLKKIVENCRGL